MKTITVREANNRIARYRGTQGLSIKEKIVGDPSATEFLDREVCVPAGFTGRLFLTVLNANVNIGGTSRPGHKCGIDGKPYTDGLDLVLSLEGGMFYAERLRKSFIEPNVSNYKGSHGGMLVNCSTVVVRSASIHNIGDPSIMSTGQSYGVEFKDCEFCTAEDLDFEGVRYGVVFTGDCCYNKALTIEGSPSIAHVDFHSGRHFMPFVADAKIIKDGNETFGGGSVEGQFYGYEELRRVTKSLANPS